MHAPPLSSEVEALLATAAAEHGPLAEQTFDVLAATMDVLLSDQDPDPSRVATLERGLLAVLAPPVVRALVDGANSPAELAARFFRLRHLVALAAVVASPRV